MNQSQNVIFLCLLVSGATIAASLYYISKNVSDRVWYALMVVITVASLAFILSLLSVIGKLKTLKASETKCSEIGVIQVEGHSGIIYKCDDGKFNIREVGSTSHQ